MKNTTVNDIVVNGVVSLLDRTSKGSWVGTMTELRTKLTKLVGTKNLELVPGSPSALRVVMNRVTRRLRTSKVKVSYTRSPDRNRTRFVELSVR